MTEFLQPQKFDTRSKLISGGGDFSDILQSHGSRVALVDEEGQLTTYDELLRAARTFGLQLGGGDPSLVFLEAANTRDALVAYVACLLGRHAIYLFYGQKDETLEALRETYQPNFILRPAEDGISIEKTGAQLPRLHPELRILLSTSGSTGSPKFVKLSEKNIVSNAAAICDYLDITASDRAITSLKFSYSYGMSVVNSYLLAGASLLLTERSVSDEAFWGLFERFGATSLAGVPFSFETIATMGLDFGRFPSLRYMTQAGGRLSPELVTHFAHISREAGWKFYVMYGQTEAAPRIAYMPPDMLDAYPQAIGVAIPGGTIELIDDTGLPVTAQGQVGELAYYGPNVMMGYAEGLDQLASDDTPARLLTGDVAQFNDAGLVEIVGRLGRFVKPFGLRLNLDEVEQRVRGHVESAIVTGNDDKIVIAVRDLAPATDDDIVREMAAHYSLPAFVFQVVRFAEIPRLGNGKIDYAGVLKTALAHQPDARPKASAFRAEFTLARNQMITMLISGLWHGPAWTFVSWGGLHGVMLVIQRQLSKLLGRNGRVELPAMLTPAAVVLQVVAVFTVVAISRIFFRSDDLPDALLIFDNLINKPYNWHGLTGKATMAISGLIMVSVMVCEFAVERGIWRRYIARNRMLRTGLALIVIMAIVAAGEFSGGRFIYVQF